MTATHGAAAREDVEFPGEGLTLRGWFYPARGGGDRAPCVVLAHGWASTKEMYLDDYAEVFAEAGLSSVVFDHRGFGASDVAPGKPRLEIDPWEQVRDYQHAITYAQGRRDVDADRVGVWGTSFSAGHALVLGATDQRVQAVSAQVPVVSGRGEVELFVPMASRERVQGLFAADRLARARGEPPMTLPLFAPEHDAEVALPGADSYAYFDTVRRERCPDWPNEITLRTFDYTYGYEPRTFVPSISPTPLLMIVAPDDRLAPGAWALAAYETGAQPKKLVMLEGGHFAAYTGEGFAVASAASRDFFVEHLLQR